MSFGQLFAYAAGTPLPLAVGLELGRRYQVRLCDCGIAPRRGQNEIDRGSVLDTPKHYWDIAIIHPDLLLSLAACHEMAGRDRHALKRDRGRLAAGDAGGNDPSCLCRND